jgi:hypothetical protein
MTQPQERAIAHVARLADGGPGDPAWRVTLHFHPDRLAAGVPILRRMADDGVYRSQFETGTSNGGLTAFPGGDRWRWESRIFGVKDQVSHLVAMAAADDKDPLDDYVEAHVHGRLDLAADVEALVLDPCYLGTAVEADAGRLGCPVEWHGGFRVTTGDLRRNAGYRDTEFAELGIALARDGRLDAAMIGDASRAGRHDEQSLKRVWHYVARFGSPGVTRRLSLRLARGRDPAVDRGGVGGDRCRGSRHRRHLPAAVTGGPQAGPSGTRGA